MKSEVFIQQELASDSSIHFHQGVWWRPSAPGVCRPVLPIHLIMPRDARPKLIRSPVGYSHFVPLSAASNRRTLYWIMEEPQLRAYGLESQSREKRKAISKALRSGLTCSRITDLGPLWPDLKEIAISMAARTGYGKPPDYYQTHFKEWQREIETEFAKPNREWWGVFLDDRLVGYQYAFLIDETMHLQNAKVHSDFLKCHASDFLYFSILEYCRTLSGCKRVSAGPASEAPGVERFKEALGFQKFEVGEYFHYNPALTILLRLVLRFHRRIRRTDFAQEEQQPGGVFLSLYRHAIRMAERIELHP